MLYSGRGWLLALFLGMKAANRWGRLRLHWPLAFGGAFSFGIYLRALTLLTGIQMRRPMLGFVGRNKDLSLSSCSGFFVSLDILIPDLVRDFLDFFLGRWRPLLGFVGRRNKSFFLFVLVSFFVFSDILVPDLVMGCLPDTVRFLFDLLSINRMIRFPTFRKMKYTAHYTCFPSSFMNILATLWVVLLTCRFLGGYSYSRALLVCGVLNICCFCVITVKY